MLFLTTLLLTSNNNFASEKKPTHGTPVIIVHIYNETDLVKVKIIVETSYLSILNLMYKDDFIVNVKRFFKDNFNISINEIPQSLQLKSISSGKEYIGILYEIEPTFPIENLNITSNCMSFMEKHDVMSFQINLNNDLKKAQITRERNFIKIHY